MIAEPKPVADDRSLSIRDFCAAEGLSPTTYFKLRQQGHGPREMRLPGTRIVRITAEARADWKKRIAKLNETQGEQLEQERAARVARTSKAGAKSVKSPNHFYGQGKRASR